MSREYGDRSNESIPKGDDELLTVPEAAKELDVSRATLYRLMDAGVIFPIPVNPLLKRPLRHLFTRDEVERVKEQVRHKQAND